MFRTYAIKDEPMDVFSITPALTTTKDNFVMTNDINKDNSLKAQEEKLIAEALAYNAEALKQFGEFALLNKVNDT